VIKALRSGSGLPRLTADSIVRRNQPEYQKGATRRNRPKQLPEFAPA